MSDIFEQAKNSTPPQVEEKTTPPQSQAAVEYNGKVWDSEAIVTKFSNADSYIEQLKAENEELRLQANRGATLEQVLDRMDNKQETPKPVEPTKTPVAEVDVEAVAMNAYQKIKQQEQMQVNLESNIAKLQEQFGDKTIEVLKERASELDMTLDEAKELAATKPKAFGRMFLSDNNNKSVLSTHGNINTQTLQQSSREKPVKLSTLKGKEFQEEFNRRAKKYTQG